MSKSPTRCSAKQLCIDAAAKRCSVVESCIEKKLKLLKETKSKLLKSGPVEKEPLPPNVTFASQAGQVPSFSGENSSPCDGQCLLLPSSRPQGEGEQVSPSCGQTAEAKLRSKHVSSSTAEDFSSSDESCHCEEYRLRDLENKGAQAGDSGLDFGDNFWDSLIHFMGESCKVMEKYKGDQPVQLTSEQKDAKMKELMKKIEAKEKEIKELNDEFRELMPTKKKCPAKLIGVCPRIKGGECPDPSCHDDYDEEFESVSITFVPQPYNINQGYQQYSPQVMPLQRYDNQIQSQNPRQQAQYGNQFIECDGKCPNPCSSNCQNPCMQAWRQY